MGELVVDQKRSKFYYALQDALKKLEQEPENGDEKKKVLPPYFNDGELYRVKSPNPIILEAKLTEEDVKRFLDLFNEEQPLLRDMEFIKR